MLKSLHILTIICPSTAVSRPAPGHCLTGLVGLQLEQLLRLRPISDVAA